MEKKVFVSIFIFIFLFGFVSSEIYLQELNSDLQKGETFVGFFEADLINKLNLNDFNIYSGRRPVEFEKGLYNYENKTFIYVVFSDEGNFTIETTKNFLYYLNGSLLEGNLNHSIFISPPSQEVLTLSPGIISGTNLSFIAKNVGEKDLSLNIQGNNYQIDENSSTRIFFEPESNFFYLDVDSYKTFKLPAFYFNESPNSTQNSSELNNISLNNIGEEVITSFFSLKDNKLERNITINESFTFGVFIENLLDEDINISVSSDSSLLRFNDTFLVESSKIKEYLFDFSSNYEGIFSSNLTFSYNNSVQELELLFLILKDEESFEDFFSYDSLFDNRSCSDVGVVCSEGQFCSGDGKLSNIGGDLCCVGGVCKFYDEIKSPKKNYLAGILSFLIVGILGYIIYKRFSNVKVSSKI